MRVKNVVKVMNFNALLNVDKAIKKASKYKNVGDEVTSILSRIIYNKNIVLDKNSLEADPSKPKLNIYIANDYGFCGNFNSEINRSLREDKDCYKIIIGKKIIFSDDLTLLKIHKDEFYTRFGEIEAILRNGIASNLYGEVNVYYNHYYSSTSFGFVKLQLFPVKLEGELYEGEDFVTETDISKVLASLLGFYMCYQIIMCESISEAAENVLRSQITSSALDKIEEKEEEDRLLENKRKKEISVKKSVENFKKIM